MGNTEYDPEDDEDLRDEDDDPGDHERVPDGPSHVREVMAIHGLKCKS